MKRLFTLILVIVINYGFIFSQKEELTINQAIMGQYSPEVF